MIKNKIRRINIIGPSGASKSTLAIQISKILHLPVIHLDKIYWKEKWEKPDHKQWLDRISDLVHSKTEYIIDGNYFSTIKERLNCGEVLIVLDFPRRIYMWRLLQRMLLKKGRNEGVADINFRFNLRHLYRYWTFATRPSQIPAGAHLTLREHMLSAIDYARSKGNSVHILKSDEDVKIFLQKISSGDFLDN